LHIICHVERRQASSSNGWRLKALSWHPGKHSLEPGGADIDKVFKALADPTRRRLLDQLHRENGQTVTALCEHMDMTRQAVTQHLQLLEDANLVAVVWHGREKLHYLNPVPLHEIYVRWIEKFERGRLGALRDLKKRLEADDDGNL